MDLIKTGLSILCIICMLSLISCSISSCTSCTATESFADTKRITFSGNLDKKDRENNNKRRYTTN